MTRDAERLGVDLASLIRTRSRAATTHAELIGQIHDLHGEIRRLRDLVKASLAVVYEALLNARDVAHPPVPDPDSVLPADVAATTKKRADREAALAAKRTAGRGLAKAQFEATYKELV